MFLVGSLGARAACAVWIITCGVHRPTRFVKKMVRTTHFLSVNTEQRDDAQRVTTWQSSWPDLAIGHGDGCLRCLKYLFPGRPHRDAVFAHDRVIWLVSVPAAICYVADCCHLGSGGSGNPFGPTARRHHLPRRRAAMETAADQPDDQGYCICRWPCVFAATSQGCRNGEGATSATRKTGLGLRSTALPANLGTSSSRSSTTSSPKAPTKALF